MTLDTYQFRNNQSVWQQTFRSRVIAISSGKGGVGKTNLSVNLGLALAQRGVRVALLDADLGTANVDVVMGIHPRYHLQHVITGRKTLAEVMVEGPYGLKIIPGASGLSDVADLPNNQREILLRALLVLDGTVDLLLIDTGAGINRSVIQFILASGEVLIVTTPEPTAITDAYALMKVLATYESPISIKLVVNNVRHNGEGEIVAQRLSRVAEQFLGRPVETVGFIPHDKHILDAVRRQSPLLKHYPFSPAASAINQLGDRLWAPSVSKRQESQVSRFFNRLFKAKKKVWA